MDDTLKVATAGLLALLVIHGSLEKRARHDATRQIREAFDRTGSVRSTIDARGMLGLLSNDVWAIDVYGERFVCDRLPFYRYPRGGWKGSIRHLRLHFSRFTLAGLPVESLEADVPFVTYDLSHALVEGRLVLRGSGSGPVLVRIDEAGLSRFILQKYKQTLSDVKVTITADKISIVANITLFGGAKPLEASGFVTLREGRYLDLTDAVIKLDHLPIRPEQAQGILNRFNPVLDIEKDLHLGDFVTMQRVKILDEGLLVEGTITIPEAKGSPIPKGSEKR